MKESNTHSTENLMINQPPSLGASFNFFPLNDSHTMNNKILVRQDDFRVLNGNNKSDLLSENFSNCTALILYNEETGERAIFHVSPWSEFMEMEAFYVAMKCIANTSDFKLASITKSHYMTTQGYSLKNIFEKTNACAQSVIIDDEFDFNLDLFDVELKQNGTVVVSAQKNREIIGTKEFSFFIKNNDFSMPQNRDSIEILVEQEIRSNQYHQTSPQGAGDF